MTHYAQTRQIGNRWITTCWTCPSLYHSARTHTEGQQAADRHNRRHQRKAEQ